MARIYGELGSLVDLFKRLDDYGIANFSSLEAIEHYIRNSQRQLDELLDERVARLTMAIKGNKAVLKSQREELTQLRKMRRELLHQELAVLVRELDEPLAETRNPISWISSRVQRWRKSSRKRKLEKDFEGEVDRPHRKKIKTIVKLENEAVFQETHFDEIIKKQMEPEYKRKAIIDGALDDLSTWLSGARGEHKVLNVLSDLSDDYYVINNVGIRIDRPMKSDEGLKWGCQIDHVVVGPTGVFNIETKNWSRQTQDNGHLRSPIKQAKFNGKVLWAAIKSNVHIGGIGFGQYRIGKKKIGVRNIVAMVNGPSAYTKNYVRVLPISELKSYIEWFDICFDDNEIEKITHFLLG